MEQFHNPEEEPVCTARAELALVDSHKFSVDEYRNRLYADIIRKRKSSSRQGKRV